MPSKELLKNKIAAAFAANELETDVVRDVAFHMTDWKDELDQLVGLYQNIESLRDSEIRKVIIGFLAHAVNHLAAAKKLIGLGPVEDVFQVGVFREDR